MSPGDAFPQPVTAESVRQYVAGLPCDLRINAIPCGEITFQGKGKTLQIARFQATFCGRACFDPIEASTLLEEQHFLSQRRVSNGSKESEHYLLFQ